jgi:hypothetical protein
MMHMGYDAMMKSQSPYDLFLGHKQYSELGAQMILLGLEMATIAQSNRFVQNPVEQITLLAKKLS